MLHNVDRSQNKLDSGEVEKEVNVLMRQADAALEEHPEQQKLIDEANKVSAGGATTARRGHGTDTRAVSRCDARTGGTASQQTGRCAILSDALAGRRPARSGTMFRARR